MRPEFLFTTFIGGCIFSFTLVEWIVTYIPNKTTFRIIMYYSLGYILALFGNYISKELNKTSSKPKKQ